MEETAHAAKPIRAAFWIPLVVSVIYLLVALACLRQWSGSRPWSRLDRFSGGYLLLSLIWTYGSSRFHRALSFSREVMREGAGMNFDPELLRWITVIGVLEIAVFLDYGQWRLTPALEQPALQWAGLGLSLVGSLWLLWVDTYLGRHFAAGLKQRNLIRDGPYAYVRHPRYAALTASHIALALTLASAIGWALVVGWLAVVLRRIRREEAHLREIFGGDYDAYAGRTARLVPGVY